MSLDQRGLTLVEIGIVLAIIGIAAAIAIPSYISMIPHIELKNGASQVADALITTRMKSVSDGKSYNVVFDLAADTVTVSQVGGSVVSTRQLDPRVDLYAVTVDPDGVVSFSGDSVTFRPNGTADTVNYEAAYLRNSPAAGERYRVKVLGVTGKVTVERWRGGAWSGAF